MTAYWIIADGGLLSYRKDWPRRGLGFNTQGFTSSYDLLKYAGML